MIRPAPVIPRHVAACQHSPLECERWFVWTWKRSDPSKQTRVPYSCNSWRCEVCRRHEAAVTFARLREAVMLPPDRVLVVPLDPRGRVSGEPRVETVGKDGPTLDPSGWCLLVLTLDREGYYGGRKWTDVNEAYREIGAMTSRVLKRIGREWGPHTRLEQSGRGKQLRTVRYLGNRWAAVVEAHRSGWPHLNLLVWCPELAAYLRAEHAARLADPLVADAVELARDAWARKEPVPAAVREQARRATVVGGRLAQLITECGWGLQSTAEAARSIEAVCSYAVKLAGMHDASVGELAKITQCPLNAPVRFRRLRSGKGFLPPRRSNPEVTGCLVRRRRSAEGDWEIQAINAPKDEAMVEPVMRARAAELDIIAEEERILSRQGQLPAMPPLRVAYGGRLEPHRVTSERRAALARRELDLAG